MKTKRLGRGLDALIPQTNSNQESDVVESISEIKISSITANPYQPRTKFDKDSLEDLKNSIKENGVIQPVTVRKAGAGFELIAGERRFRAVQELGFKRIPAYVIEVGSEEKLLELALIENIQREDLNPIEVARAYKQLQQEYGLTQEQVSVKVGKDRATVANFIRLLKLPGKIQDSLKSGEISMGHARVLTGLKNEHVQIKLWKKIIKENLSVRKVEQEAQKLTEKKSGSVAAASQKNPYIDELEEKLRSRLGTQVKITPKSKGGKIEINYYSNDDLERLMDIIQGE
ncbi:DNA-binding protein [candidate division KSB1 bacterium]|nr:MAG: DNA-binding protein [candidate division KSB1 bacterium]